jgi:hypothetical protein
LLTALSPKLSHAQMKRPRTAKPSESLIAWLKTTQGVITAITGVLTAFAALIAALHAFAPKTDASDPALGKPVVQQEPRATAPIGSPTFQAAFSLFRACTVDRGMRLFDDSIPGKLQAPGVLRSLCAAQSQNPEAVRRINAMTDNDIALAVEQEIHEVTSNTKGDDDLLYNATWCVRHENIDLPSLKVDAARSAYGRCQHHNPPIENLIAVVSNGMWGTLLTCIPNTWPNYGKAVGQACIDQTRPH